MVFGQLVSSQYGTNAQPVSSDITGNVVHSLATVVYHQHFIIDKADYFNLFLNNEEGMVIYNVTADFNDKKTTFIVHELNAPIVNNSYGFDQGVHSDALTLTLGKIPENTKVEIEIFCSFASSLKDPKTLEFLFPFNVHNVGTQLSVDLNINDPTAQLSKAEMNYSSDKKGTHLIVEKKKINDRPSLMLEYKMPLQSIGLSTKIDQYDYLALSLIPSIPKNATVKQEIYLLIDCSGSMGGDKIKKAMDSLIEFLKNLPKDCFFNIIRFGSTFEQMFEHSVPYSSSAINQALSFAKGLKADLGGTDIYSPMMSIIEEPIRPGFVRQVFALTDGCVSNSANVLASCLANRDIMRIFPFGIGTDVDRAFLTELGAATNGKASFITDGVRLSSVVINCLQCSQNPGIVNSQVFIEGSDSFEITPHPIPVLFDGFINHLFVKYNSDNSIPLNERTILISGEIGDNCIEQVIEIYQIQPIIDIKKYFAYHNIRDLEDLIITSPPEKMPELKASVIRLSSQSALVSSFTGMFTVINGEELKEDIVDDLVQTVEEDLINQDDILVQQQWQQQAPIQQMFNQIPMPQMSFNQAPQQQRMKQMAPQQQFMNQNMNIQCQMCQQPMNLKQQRNQSANSNMNYGYQNQNFTNQQQQSKRQWGGATFQQNQAPKTQAQSQSNQIQERVQSKNFICNNLLFNEIPKLINAEGIWDLKSESLISQITIHTDLATLKTADKIAVENEDGNCDLIIINALIISWLMICMKKYEKVWQRYITRALKWLEKQLGCNPISPEAILNITKTVQWK